MLLREGLTRKAHSTEKRSCSVRGLAAKARPEGARPMIYEFILFAL